MKVEKKTTIRLNERVGINLEGANLVLERVKGSLTPDEAERVSYLKSLLEQTVPLSELKDNEKGKMAELVVEYSLSLQGIGVSHLPIKDPRDLLIYKYTNRDKQSAVQVKYLNYATKYRKKSGSQLTFSPKLIESKERFALVILAERISGDYEFLIKTKEEMLQLIETIGKERPSDPGREKHKRIRVYVPLKFIKDEWSKSYGNWDVILNSFNV